MDVKDLQLGPRFHYRLTRDVKNPASDRRSDMFAALPVWVKGSVVCCTYGHHPETQEKFLTGFHVPGTYTFDRHRVSLHAWAGSRRITSPAFLAILAALEPVEPSNNQLLESALEEAGHVSAFDVLAQMLYATPISPEDERFRRMLETHFHEAAAVVLGRYRVREKAELNNPDLEEE